MQWCPTALCDNSKVMVDDVDATVDESNVIVDDGNAIYMTIPRYQIIVNTAHGEIKMDVNLYKYLAAVKVLQCCSSCKALSRTPLSNITLSTIALLSSTCSHLLHINIAYHHFAIVLLHNAKFRPTV